MTTASEMATEWNDVIDAQGNSVTLYDPTITYNDEGDVNAYTLNAGSTIKAIIIQSGAGTAYASEVEGIDDRKTLGLLVKTTDTVDNESILSIDSSYYTVTQGSLRQIKEQDTVIAQRLSVKKMLPQEAAKIA